MWEKKFNCRFFLMLFSMVLCISIATGVWSGGGWPITGVEFSQSRLAFQAETEPVEPEAVFSPFVYSLRNDHNRHIDNLAVVGSSSRVIKTSPGRGDMHFQTNYPLRVTYNNEITQGPNFAQIYLSDSEENTVDASLYLMGPDLFVVPRSDLKYAATYTLKVPADALSDGEGNIEEEFVLEFGTTNQLPAYGLLVENPPGTISDYHANLTMNFGPGINGDDVTDLVALADPITAYDDQAGEAVINNSSEINGKIALIQRGGTTFVEKIHAAQEAGAVGVIMYNNTDLMTTMGGEDTNITIPSVFISQLDGETIKAALEASEEVKATIYVHKNFFCFESEGVYNIDENTSLKFSVPEQYLEGFVHATRINSDASMSYPPQGMIPAGIYFVMYRFTDNLLASEVSAQIELTYDTQLLTTGIDPAQMAAYLMPGRDPEAYELLAGQQLFEDSQTFHIPFVPQEQNIGVFAPSDWVFHVKGVNYPFYDIAYGGDRYVASNINYSGSSGLFTSSDGENWTDIFQGNGLAWGNSIFVAVGSGGNIITSGDGQAWTQRYSGTTNDLHSVTYSGSKFVAVGEGGTVATSENGINWTSDGSGVTQTLQDLFWDGEQFIAVGESGAVLASPDGLVWTPRISGTGEYLFSISGSGDLYVAVGAWGTIITSNDGITWTPRTSNTTNVLEGVAWNGSIWITVGRHSTVLTSSNGVTWTAQAYEINRHITMLRAFEGSFYAAAPAYGIIKSSDGTSWNRLHENNNFSLIIHDLAGAEGNYVAVGEKSYILTTSDLESWEEEYYLEMDSYFGVTWGDEQFVAVSLNTFMSVSTDGLLWRSDYSGPWVTMNDITYNNGVYVAVGENGTIRTSSDGLNWENRVSGTTENLIAVTWGGPLFIAVGYNGTILASDDHGISWSSINVPGLDKNLKDITWDGSRFLVVGDQGTYLTSNTGISWQVKDTFTDRVLYTVASSGSCYMAAGVGGEVFYSIDGDDWVAKGLGYDYLVRSIIWKNQSYRVVGYSESIYSHLSFIASIPGEAVVEIYGDINGDGVVDVTDVVLSMQHILGLIQLQAEQQKAADVNGDGAIDVSDVVLIMQRVLGLIGQFPVEG